MIDRNEETQPIRERTSSLKSRRRRVDWEGIRRICQTMDAVENGGLFNDRWGGRVFDPTRNPYWELEVYRQGVELRKS